MISSFNALTEKNQGIASLRLTTVQHIHRTKVLVISLLATIAVLLVVAIWGVLT